MGFPFIAPVPALPPGAIVLFSLSVRAFPGRPHSPCLTTCAVTYHHTQHPPCPPQQFVKKRSLCVRTPLRRRRAQIKGTCMCGVRVDLKWGIHPCPSIMSKNCARNGSPCNVSLEDNRFTPCTGERDVRPPPILDEVTDLENWEYKN